MDPKSYPVTISGTLTIAVGTALSALAVALPDWTESSFPSKTRQKTGLFEICVDGSGCSNRGEKSDELLLVTGLSLASSIVAFLALLMALMIICMARKKTYNKCMELLPWITILWSLVSGGGSLAALVIFENKVYVSAEYVRLGMSFFFLAAGGGLEVIGGILVCVGGQYLNSYFKTLEEKDPQYYAAE